MNGMVQAQKLSSPGSTEAIAAAARLITAIENRMPGLEQEIESIYREGGRAHTIGVTGAPGSGKSSLVSAMVTELRRRGASVAVVAVDPSSSLTGGAILGDRIRMQDHAVDPLVFVRSMSSRGAVGGLSRATVDAVAVLDAAGWDYVLVETVGVGQADVDIVRVAETVVVVSVPGLGDDIQAIKAGLLEVADVHVVNKADKPEAARTAADLLAMLTLAGPPGSSGWAVPVVSTSALTGSGVCDLLDWVGEHVAWLEASDSGAARRRAAAAAQIHLIASDLLLEAAADLRGDASFDDLVDGVAARRIDPHRAARELVVAANRTLKGVR